jgi:SAM-dependent methyltransferase
MKADLMHLSQRSAELDISLSDLEVNDYDDIASIFDETMGSDFLNIIFDPTVKVIQRIFRKVPRIRHLDLACGTGLFVCRLAATCNTEAFGIDLSKGQIDEAIARADAENVTVQFQIGDMISATLPPDCHLITCNLDSLNHIQKLDDWKLIFQKVRGSLLPGGVFLFDVNTPDRLVDDWDVPEVIIKRNLVYVQCGLKVSRRNKTVRRRLFMQIFSERSRGYKRSAALVEQIAVPKNQIFEMLKKTGFQTIEERVLGPRLRNRHMFMRNRLFVLARA